MSSSRTSVVRASEDFASVLLKLYVAKRTYPEHDPAGAELMSRPRVDAERLAANSEMQPGVRRVPMWMLRQTIPPQRSHTSRLIVANPTFLISRFFLGDRHPHAGPAANTYFCASSFHDPFSTVRGGWSVTSNRSSVFGVGVGDFPWVVSDVDA